MIPQDPCPVGYILAQIMKAENLSEEFKPQLFDQSTGVKLLEHHMVNKNARLEYSTIGGFSRQ